eukprot:TRINITY_DN6726_c0_g1_i14.p1 TRINITY_DN6726_c0_g1~~TRINITY_DN6726_c0_g1_i14.p1  ORF type:complete len:444 (+),score=57.54 TRINITY_DN6726_c0_g1_i14:115-1446(+)
MRGITLTCVVSLLCFVNADIMRLDKWSMLQSMSIQVLESVFEELKSSTFPDFSHSFDTFIFTNYMKIFDLRISKITPRYSFLSAVFYPDRHNTFTVSMPLGFHVTIEFTWSYNWFIVPISGTAKVDTDVYDLVYNTTFRLEWDVKIDTSFGCEMVKVKEVETKHLLGIENWIDASSKLVTTLDSYFPLLHQRIGVIFMNVLPGIFKSHVPKSFQINLYFPLFHVVKDLKLPLVNVTTCNALPYAFGDSAPFPENIGASEKIDRQYCVDNSLVRRVVEEVFSLTNAVFHKENLPKNAVYQISMNGLAQLIPDVVIEYPKNAAVELKLTLPKGQSNEVRISRFNDTYAVVKNIPIKMVFEVNKDPVLSLSLKFDILVSPKAERRSTGYDLDLHVKKYGMRKVIRTQLSLILSIGRSYCVTFTPPLQSTWTSYSSPTLGIIYLGMG